MIGGLWSVAAMAGLIGVAVGWLLRAIRARRHDVAERPESSPVAEPDYLRREVSRLRSAEQRLARQLAEKDVLIATAAAASRAEREKSLEDLEGARHQLDQLRQQLAEAENTGGAAAERASGLAADQAVELRAALDRAMEVSARAAADRARAEKQAADAETARALHATEGVDLKRRLAAMSAAIDQIRNERDAAVADRLRLEAELARREAEVRSRSLVHQAEIAARDAEIGALQAQVARNEMLQRRVEDRELLLRSVAAERDQAAAAHHAGQRDLKAAIEHQRREAAARLALERTIAEREVRIASLEAAIVRLTKEGEDRTGLATRAAGLVDTLRAEIRERDVRFQALLGDRRRTVEGFLTEIARLREELARNGNHVGEAKTGNGRHQDDLKRISGIGPAMEKLLHDRGVTSFRQIASWTEDDVQRIAAELGSFRDRIRRDDWVTQARREHEASYGERLDR